MCALLIQSPAPTRKCAHVRQPPQSRPSRDLKIQVHILHHRLPVPRVPIALVHHRPDLRDDGAHVLDVPIAPALLQRLERRLHVRAVGGLERRAAQQEHGHQQHRLHRVLVPEAVQQRQPGLHARDQPLHGPGDVDGPVQVDPRALPVQLADELAGGLVARPQLALVQVEVDARGLVQGGRVEQGLAARGAPLPDVLAQVGDLGDVDEEAVEDAEVGAGGGGDEGRQPERVIDEEAAPPGADHRVGDVVVGEELGEEAADLGGADGARERHVAARVEMARVLAVGLARDDAPEEEHADVRERGVVVRDGGAVRGGALVGGDLLPEEADGAVEVVEAAFDDAGADVVGDLRFRVVAAELVAGEAQDGVHQPFVLEGHGDDERVEGRFLVRAQAQRLADVEHEVVEEHAVLVTLDAIDERR